MKKIKVIYIAILIIILGCTSDYHKVEETEQYITPTKISMPIVIDNIVIDNINVKPESITGDSEFIPSFDEREYQIPENLLGYNDFWVEIDISEQALYLHYGSKVISGFRISSGRPSEDNRIGQDTPHGLYKIYRMYDVFPMWGSDYHIPDVPFVMFFHHEYALHGAYWHNDFGIPVTHGCINMNVNDAEWIYSNMKKGSYVYVHE